MNGQTAGARMVFQETIWRTAEAGLYDEIERVRVSPDIFEVLDWVEMDGRIMWLVVSDPRLREMTCLVETARDWVPGMAQASTAN